VDNSVGKDKQERAIPTHPLDAATERAGMKLTIASWLFAMAIGMLLAWIDRGNIRYAIGAAVFAIWAISTVVTQ